MLPALHHATGARPLLLSSGWPTMSSRWRYRAAHGRRRLERLALRRQPAVTMTTKSRSRARLALGIGEEALLCPTTSPVSELLPLECCL